jgi:hypothetical protein
MVRLDGLGKLEDFNALLVKELGYKPEGRGFETR